LNKAKKKIVVIKQNVYKNILYLIKKNNILYCIVIFWYYCSF